MRDSISVRALLDSASNALGVCFAEFAVIKTDQRISKGNWKRLNRLQLADSDYEKPSEIDTLIGTNVSTLMRDRFRYGRMVWRVVRCSGIDESTDAEGASQALVES